MEFFASHYRNGISLYKFVVVMTRLIECSVIDPNTVWACALGAVINYQLHTIQNKGFSP
jgi:hypothetical protein